MYCTEESTCDIVWTFWRLRSYSALPVVIRCPGNCAPLAPLVTPLRPYKCQLVLLGFEKNETAAVAKDIVSEFSTKTRWLHV